jgi:hypothetical protein
MSSPTVSNLNPFPGSNLGVLLLLFFTRPVTLPIAGLTNRPHLAHY